jgi:hypothetical protein
MDVYLQLVLPDSYKEYYIKIYSWMSISNYLEIGLRWRKTPQIISCRSHISWDTLIKATLENNSFKLLRKMQVSYIE